MGQRPNHGKGTKVLQKLGINESYQLAMYLLDQYRGTVLSCRYDNPPSIAPKESRTRLEEAVKIAVADTIMRHPMLQVGMTNSTSKTPLWIQLQSLDLAEHIKWVYIDAQDNFEQMVQDAFCRGMCVGASWPDCAVDATLGERIMTDLERWMAQLARQP